MLISVSNSSSPVAATRITQPTRAESSPAGLGLAAPNRYQLQERLHEVLKQLTGISCFSVVRYSAKLAGLVTAMTRLPVKPPDEIFHRISQSQPER